MLDVATCAMAFRILQMNGYDVSSDELSHVAEASTLHKLYEGGHTRSLLELYKASMVSISEDNFILDRIGSWSGFLLKEQLRCSDAAQTNPLLREVEYALNFPFYANLDRLEHRRNIEHFDALGTLCLPGHTSEDIVGLAVRDFNTCQSIYQQELQHLSSWVKDNRLDQLPFARQRLAHSYLAAAGTIFPQELSDARIFWTKSCVLAFTVDDFFDVGGSKEELENLVALVEMWDDHHKPEYHSEHVEIVFSAMYNSVIELGGRASALQGRDVTKHLVEIWLDYLRSVMTEEEWRLSKYVPSVEEYMTNATLSFALGPIVLPTLYTVGPKIPESVVRDPEYTELFRLMCTICRRLNDIQSYERAENQGKLNSVSLLVLGSGGRMSVEEARREIQKPIERCRRELLRLVLSKEAAAVPRPCKELFWKMCKVCCYYYARTDSSNSLEEKAGDVEAVISHPLQLDTCNA